MNQKKVNERIAMAMLRQCALVWEHCTVLDAKVVECELKFADVWNGMGDYRMWKKCPIGHIDVNLDKCEYQDVFDRKMWEMEGVLDYWPDGRWTRVQMFFRTSDTDPQMGFGCGYPVERVFEVARDFCQMNGCPSLLSKTVFGIDSNGKYARLPEVKATKTKTKTITKTAAPKKNLKPETKSEPTLEDRLRAALRKQLAMAA